MQTDGKGGMRYVCIFLTDSGAIAAQHNQLVFIYIRFPLHLRTELLKMCIILLILQDDIEVNCKIRQKKIGSSEFALWLIFQAFIYSIFNF